MSRAFVITTNQMTAGILADHRKGLHFEASNAATMPLHNRIFASPEAAQSAVERLMKRRAPQAGSQITVSCRRVW